MYNFYLRNIQVSHSLVQMYVLPVSSCFLGCCCSTFLGTGYELDTSLVSAVIEHCSFH